MKMLIGGGHVTRRQLRHGVIYTVHPGGAAPTPVILTPDNLTGDNMTPDILAATPVILAPKAQQSTNRRKKTTSSPSSARPAAASAGTRLVSDFSPPDDWLEWAAMERGWSILEAQGEADAFRDYWIAQPGARGRKADWPATWRNWVRRSRRQPSSIGNQHGRTDRHGGDRGAGYVRDRPVDGFTAALRIASSGGRVDDDGRG
ncbi:hypothetical protein ACWGNZ_00865 [Sphingomonas zeae]